MSSEIVKFIRRKDYKVLEELGQGACGKTVLLQDDMINENFVCKKFVPYSESSRVELFNGFTREVKILHKVNHENVVRVFNYYLYPEDYTGYILMEYIKGTDIQEYLEDNPDRINEIFIQAINGFSYLETEDILHRDIRPLNLMVNEKGILKIIDFGFGKEIKSSKDYDKSVSLNWWCAPPDEFNNSHYDFSTEVYFVGNLFKKIIHDNSIDCFNYTDILLKMCQSNPNERIVSFLEVDKILQTNKFLEIHFEDDEKYYYRDFADTISTCITQIEGESKYKNNIESILVDLENEYRSFMLEVNVPDSAVVIRCLLEGQYYYRKHEMKVSSVKGFIHLLKSAPNEKRKIIISNLQTRLDAIERYHQKEIDNLPF